MVELKTLIKEAFPGVILSEDFAPGKVSFMEISVGKQFVSIEYRSGLGYGIIANREILPFEGSDEVYSTAEQAFKRIKYILKNHIVTGKSVAAFISQRLAVNNEGLFFETDYIVRMTKLPKLQVEKEISELNRLGKIKSVIRLQCPDGVLLEGNYENESSIPESVPNRFYTHNYLLEECTIIRGYKVIVDRWKDE